MKDKILEIVAKYPRHYIKLIKKDPELVNWILSNSLLDDPIVDVKNTYSAVHQITDRCQYGNFKKISRWGTGFVGCGPSSVCKCTNESISQNVKKTKNNYTQQQKQEINDKRSQTMISKYGVEFNSQRSDIHHIWLKPKIQESVYIKLIDQSWLREQYVTKNRTAVDIAQELGIYYSTVLDYCIKHDFEIKKHSNYSLTEIEIKNYIQSLGTECLHSVWNLLENKEIDLYVPDKNLAIEINGLYWHSWHPSMNTAENRFRHLEKSQLLAEKGIDLFHITDWEWRNKQDIVKSIINNRLGLSIRYSARKTEIRSLSIQQAREFFLENHLQGFIHSQYYFGLFYENQLLMALSAGHSRFKKDKKIVELHRLATKKYCLVVGGGSKLITHLKNQIGDCRIVSYCDRSKSSGKGYRQMGFHFVESSGPGYFWTNGNEIISRYQASRKRLKKWLANYDPDLSESKNMFNNGYRRYWDCGNLVFEI